MGRTSTSPSNDPDRSGPFTRVITDDRLDQQFHSSAFMHSDATSHRPEVQVQSYIPDTRGGGPGQTPVTHLVVVAEFGQADVMLSPDEARKVAETLLLAARDAEAFEALRPWYREAQLAELRDPNAAEAVAS